MVVRPCLALFAARRRSLAAHLAATPVHDLRSRTSKCSSGRMRRCGLISVEVAIVAPVFLLFVFGMIEFGRMVMIKQSMTNAAREGARVAVLATTTNPNDITAKVRDKLRTVIPNVAAVRVTTPPVTADTASGTELVVAVEVDFSAVSWLPVGYFGFNPTIGEEARQRRE